MVEAAQSMETAQTSGAMAHQPILRRIDLLHRSDQHQRVTGLQAQIRRPLSPYLQTKQSREASMHGSKMLAMRS